MAAPSENVEAQGAQAVDDAEPRTTVSDPLVCERLISETSAAWVAVPAEAFEGRIDGAIGQVAEFLDGDYVTRPSFPEDRQLRVTHQWVRPGAAEQGCAPAGPQGIAGIPS